MTYTFTFDASACSGCKACQEACKDKNKLPVGVLWRRVIEVTGGEWQKTRAAWENSIFAYNLSLSCNHCVHAKCAGVCPTDAYSVRPDGIVMLDSSKCMGCGYCAWACPYGAPQYVSEKGVMTKCDFCYDSLDAGLPPTCVAACPLRALDFETTAGAIASKGFQALWQLQANTHPFPLPGYSRTEPHLAVKPHPAMNYALEKTVSNREEIQPGLSINPPGIAAFEELPLVAFTLLVQTAVGLSVFGLALSPLPWPLLLAIGALLGAGGLISFLHLGRKPNAWRAVLHLKKSWLSREVLMAGLFGAAWALTFGLEWVHKASLAPLLMTLLGIGLVYSMSRVYYLKTVPAWNTWRTTAAFFLSAILLGALGVNLIAPHPGWLVAAGIALVVEMGMVLAAQPFAFGTTGRLRIALLGLGLLGTLLIIANTQIVGAWSGIFVFLLALAAEAIGRWQFYAQRRVSPL